MSNSTSSAAALISSKPSLHWNLSAEEFKSALTQGDELDYDLQQHHHNGPCPGLPMLLTHPTPPPHISSNSSTSSSLDINRALRHQTTSPLPFSASQTYSSQRSSGSSTAIGNRKLQYKKTKLCPWYALDRCYMSEKCNYAHGETEIRNKPNLANTKLCNDIERGLPACTKPPGQCTYAHSIQELRATPTFFKTKLCKYYLKNKCPAGKNCRHAHGQSDLRYPSSPAHIAGTTPSFDHVAATNGPGSRPFTQMTQISQLTTSGTTAPSLNTGGTGAGATAAANAGRGVYISASASTVATRIPSSVSSAEGKQQTIEEEFAPTWFATAASTTLMSSNTGMTDSSGEYRGPHNGRENNGLRADPFEMKAVDCTEEIVHESSDAVFGVGKLRTSPSAALLEPSRRNIAFLSQQAPIVTSPSFRSLGFHVLDSPNNGLRQQFGCGAVTSPISSTNKQEHKNTSFHLGPARTPEESDALIRMLFNDLVEDSSTNNPTGAGSGMMGGKSHQQQVAATR